MACSVVKLYVGGIIMNAVINEKFTTGNAKLDAMLPLLNASELEKLDDYANYLMWSRKDDDEDTSWADAPLTEEEEEALRQGREDYKNGDYLTLEEFRARQQENTSWADEPLTPEEEAEAEEGRREFERGEFLTLEEFMKQL